jgi:hypothetical protein
MALIAGDVLFSGFGNTGFFLFANPLPAPPAGIDWHAATARLIRIVKGTRAGVDIRGIDAMLTWTSIDFSGFVTGACICGVIEIIRSSSQVNALPTGIEQSSPGGGLSPTQYPAGFESLWMTYATSPAVSAIPPAAVSPAVAGTPFGCAPPSLNSWRFDPGVMYADQDHQLIIVMYTPINFGTLQTVFQNPDTYRSFSVHGVDYGQQPGPSGASSNLRSMPRSAVR